jgi:hypothetical protein
MEKVAEQKVLSEQPWTLRQDWVDGTIADYDSAISVRTLAWFSVVWNLFSWPFATAGLWSTDSLFAWLALPVFPLVGIALVVLTLRKWRRECKFGTSVFHCRTVPAWLGGRLQGTVSVSRADASLARRDFKFRLVCVRKTLYRGRKSSDDRESEEELWEEATTGQTQWTGAPPLEISVDVPVPSDQPPTTMTPAASCTFWRLYVTCEVPGVDYKAVFEVPVFAPPVAQLAG